jgi:hypothetical protein
MTISLEQTKDERSEISLSDIVEFVQESWKQILATSTWTPSDISELSLLE